MAEFDKYKSCKGCPDRWCEGTTSCHSTCEGYLSRVKQNEKKREERIQQQVLNDNLHCIKNGWYKRKDPWIGVDIKRLT